MRFSNLIILFSVVLMAGCQTASEPKTNEANLARINSLKEADLARNALLKQDQPLRAFSIMERISSEQKFLTPLAAQYSAFVGRESITRKMANAGTPKRVPDKSIAVSDLIAADAIQEIVAASRAYSVVIIHDEHTNQRERVFAHLLAKALRKNGFTLLGIEALASGRGTEVNKIGLLLGNGFYTADPVFADFVRDGVAQGYTIFDYEPTEDFSALDYTGQMVAREKGQAANIKKVLDATPNAKALIYAGGGHGAKNPQKDNLLLMGAHLVTLLGTDVLSIRQGAPQSERVFDSPAYQSVESELLSNGSTVFRKKNGKWLDEPGFDMIVFHPRVPEAYGRGTWMSTDGHRKLKVINVEPLPARTLVRARALPVQKNGIAMDQVMIDAGSADAALYLPVGEYVVLRESESGESQEIGRVSIK
jgi:hypothetical protein